MQSLSGAVVPILCRNFVGKQCDMVPVVYILWQNQTPWLHRIHTHIEQRLHEFATDILSGLAFWGFQKVWRTESSKIAVSETCHSACHTRFDSQHRVVISDCVQLQTKSPIGSNVWVLWHLNIQDWMDRITEWKIQWFSWYTRFDFGFHHVIHSGSIGTLWFTLNRSIRTLSFDLNALVSMQSWCRGTHLVWKFYGQMDAIWYQ